MTLIVGAEGKIFADDLVISRADKDTADNDTFVHVRKLYIDSTKRAAVGVLGNVISNPDTCKAIIDIITQMVIRYELNIDSPEISEETISVITDSGNRSFFVMTKKDYYRFDHRLAISICSDEVEHAYGSGDIGFTMARAMGLTVEQCYDLINDTIYTVGKLTHTVSKTQLKPIVLTKSLAKLKEKSNV